MSIQEIKTSEESDLPLVAITKDKKFPKKKNNNIKNVNVAESNV